MKNFSLDPFQLKETGYIQSLRMKWWDEQAECIEKKDPLNTPTSLTFHDMAGVCAILAAGVCLALIFLLAEIKLKNTMANCCSKRGHIARKVCIGRLSVVYMIEAWFPREKW